MVRAILEGRKTQTRRIVKPPGLHFEYVPDGVKGPYWRAGEWHRRNGVMTDISSGPWHGMNDNGTRQWVLSLCPYGQPGDRLWVKETYSAHGELGDWGRKYYRADLGDHAREPHGLAWRPSIFMSRSASRITLEVTGVRVERLQDISCEDAKSEGCTVDSWHYPVSTTPGKSAYRTLWESINGPDSWDANPWVWVISFKRIKP